LFFPIYQWISADRMDLGLDFLGLLGVSNYPPTFVTLTLLVLDWHFFVVSHPLTLSIYHFGRRMRSPDAMATHPGAPFALPRPPRWEEKPCAVGLPRGGPDNVDVVRVA
jgi:hypothetical protein